MTGTVDPRPAVIDKRLAGVRRILAVTGWKGGIGKSLTASTLALLFSRKGLRTGLFDLDFSGASCHLILGAGGVFPEEEKGIVPPLVSGVRLMSAAFFSKNRAIPLRGAEASSAMLELLAITRWGELDFLVLDMPPGIGDAGLDVVRWMRRAELMVVTTPSVLAQESAKRALALYQRLGVKTAGVVENMRRGEPLPAFEGAQTLGSIDFDPGLEPAIGDPDRLLKTAFARGLSDIADKHFLKGG